METLIIALFVDVGYTISMADETIFHKILARQIPAQFVYEDEDVVVFYDIHPKAPTHLLFVPKLFVASVSETTEDNEYLPGMLILKARDFAKEKGIPGYKLTFHVGKEGGQEVPYLHLHFLAQKEL